MNSIIILEDNVKIASYYEEILTDNGYQVDCAHNDDDFLALYPKILPDLIILDIKLNNSKLSGLDIFELLIKKSILNSKVIILSGEATRSEIAQAMKLGAYTFLEKSGEFNIDKFLLDIKQAINLKLQEEKNATLQKDYEAIRTKLIETMPLIGNSPAILDVKKRISKFAQADIDVLIVGETGTGKEVVANNFYWQSRRVGKPFIKVNAGGLPETLIDSELYGHKKGSFTGAVSDRKGYFEQANGGILFLDEITNLSLTAQAKILRTIENREISIVGGKTKFVNIQMIFACNRELQQLISENIFRDDLFYRLEGNTITLPPLRERGDDILLFMKHFINLFSIKYNLPTNIEIVKLKKHFISYHWPGNIRELEKFFEYVFILNKQIDNNILINELNKKIEGNNNSLTLNNIDLNDPDYQKTMDKFEKKYLLHQLLRCDKSIPKLAKLLGLDKSTLYKKFKKSDYMIN